MSVHLGQLLAQRAALTPAKEAVIYADKRLTFAQFDVRCTRLANYLVAHGVQEGDRVAVYSKNSEFLACALFAIARTGAISVVLNWRFQEAELSYILSDSTPVALLYEEAFSQVTKELLARHVDLTPICSGALPAFNSYEEIVEDPRLGQPLCLGKGGGAPAVIMYTSGTTGKPKGAILSHSALIWTAQSSSNTLEWNQDHRFLLVAPMFHIGGLSPLITNVLKGCLTVLMADFNPVQVWQTIAKERITSLMSVPVMLQALLMATQKLDVDTSSLVSVTCGASAVPKSLIEACLNIGVTVQQVYGITEFCGAVTFWMHEMGIETAHTQGKPLLCSDLQISDPATLKPVKHGQDGEIWCRGPMLFSGYWENADATSAAMHDGWYRTGDIGRIDDDGFLLVVDRLKDMIISGGENIYPAELEAVISTIPGIKEVAVVGRRDKRWGEVPIAYVVPMQPDTITESCVIEHCRSNLASYKCVKEVKLIDALPRSPVGKVLKQQLRE